MMKTSFHLLARRTAQLAIRTPVAPAFSSCMMMRMMTSSKTPSEDTTMPPFDGHLDPEKMDVLTHMYDHIDKLENQVSDLKKASSEKPQYDGHLNPEQMEALKLRDRISDIESHVAEIKKAMAEARKTYAVDAPDGDSDGHVKEDLLEVEHIIEDAAAHEDKDAINKKHKLQEDVKKFHARDPEHDW